VEEQTPDSQTSRRITSFLDRVQSEIVQPYRSRVRHVDAMQPDTSDFKIITRPQDSRRPSKAAITLVAKRSSEDVLQFRQRKSSGPLPNAPDSVV
jgi:hypothetical protein